MVTRKYYKDKNRPKQKGQLNKTNKLGTKIANFPISFPSENFCKHSSIT